MFFGLLIETLDFYFFAIQFMLFLYFTKENQVISLEAAAVPSSLFLCSLTFSHFQAARHLFPLAYYYQIHFISSLLIEIPTSGKVLFSSSKLFFY